MDVNLKPCPFDGSHAELRVEPYDRPTMFYIVCSHPDCHLSMGEFYDRDGDPDHTFMSVEDAEAAWNRRAE